MQWTDGSGRPLVMKFGRRWHKTRMRTDHIMMILLRRLAFPCRWCDLILILGGLISELSEAYNFALKFIFHKFCPLVSRLDVWKENFSRFAQRLSDMGVPFDNLVSFVDGHFNQLDLPSPQFLHHSPHPCMGPSTLPTHSPTQAPET